MPSVVRKRISELRVGQADTERLDALAVEEPLEIRIVFGSSEKRRSKSLSVTMRTPGDDFELAAGFLLSEGLVTHPRELLSFQHVGPPPTPMEVLDDDKQLPAEPNKVNQAICDVAAHGNTLLVELAPDVEIATEKLQRHFYTTSSCGVCGKASLDAITAQGVSPLAEQLSVKRDVIFQLPAILRGQQAAFEQTGGLHAAGLATATGSFTAIREDVGRHNAVDKLVGSQMLAGEFPINQKILVVSGRASFELMQKCLVAGIEMLVAVGAPSSLAVELAQQFNLTLIGFTSEKRYNVYSNRQRVI